MGFFIAAASLFWLSQRLPTNPNKKPPINALPRISVRYRRWLNASSSSRMSFITASKSGSWPKYISRIFS